MCFYVENINLFDSFVNILITIITIYIFKVPLHSYSKLHFLFYFSMIMIKIKLATVVEGNQKAPFSIASTPRIAPRYP